MLTILWTIFIKLHLVCGNNLQNILFIVIDDMRPEIGSYSTSNDALYPDIFTPNMDKLAQDGVLMMNAYVNYPLCAPSRQSFLTGRRPDTIKVYDLNTYWRDAGGNFTTIPQYFKDSGYVTFGAGKIFHGTPTSGEGHNDNVYSWSSEFYDPETRNYWESRNSTWRIALPHETASIPLPDNLVKDYAVTKLNELAEGAISGEMPFFLAVGFLKPHLPFIAPESFYDLYPENSIDLPKDTYVAENYPDVAWYKMYELSTYSDINTTIEFNNTLPDNQVLAMRRGYYACVSYIDSLIGELLDELDRLNLANDTIVIISSDHGYNLGEHAMWGKCNNNDLAVKVPIIIKIPGLSSDRVNKTVDAFVENVDLFPTIVEASGLPLIEECPANSSETDVCHEGLSMMPLILGEVDSDEWKDAIFSQYFKFEDTEYTTVMGYSIRETNYHYVKWIHFENNTAYWQIIYGAELYDIRFDPNEDINVIDEPAYSKEIVRLNERLIEGWRGALPS